MDSAPKLPLDSALLRFGPAAEVLADALRMMSLSLVKIVCNYLVCPTARARSTPTRLFCFGSASKGEGDGDGTFGSCVYGVACSADNEIWTGSGDKVQIFSADGKFLRHALKGRWLTACCMALAAADGLAYVVDYSANCITVCRQDGSLVKRFGGKAHNHPYGAAIYDKLQLLFVTDTNNDRVAVWKTDSPSTFVRSFGSKGSGDGQFSCPLGIAVNALGEVAVADEKNSRIQVFNAEGKFLRKFGSEGSEHGQLKGPYGVTADQCNNWIVCDQFNHRMQWFTADGSFLTAYGDRKVFSYLHGVCLDLDGRILVSDAGQIDVYAFE